MTLASCFSGTRRGAGNRGLVKSMPTVLVSPVRRLPGGLYGPGSVNTHPERSSGRVGMWQVAQPIWAKVFSPSSTAASIAGSLGMTRPGTWIDACHSVTAVTSARVSSLVKPSPSGSVSMPNRSVDWMPWCWLMALLVNSRIETTLAAWCQGQITRVGGLFEPVERRLNRGSPSTRDVSQRPSRVSALVANPAPRRFPKPEPPPSPHPDKTSDFIQLVAPIVEGGMGKARDTRLGRTDPLPKGAQLEKGGTDRPRYLQPLVPVHDTVRSRRGLIEPQSKFAGDRRRAWPVPRSPPRSRPYPPCYFPGMHQYAVPFQPETEALDPTAFRRTP